MPFKLSKDSIKLNPCKINSAFLKQQYTKRAECSVSDTVLSGHLGIYEVNRKQKGREHFSSVSAPGA